MTIDKHKKNIDYCKLKGWRKTPNLTKDPQKAIVDNDIVSL